MDISKQDGGALSDKQVYDLYLNGPYPSLFEKMVNSISMKFISFADDDQPEGKPSEEHNSRTQAQDAQDHANKATETVAVAGKHAEAAVVAAQTAVAHATGNVLSSLEPVL